MKVKKFHWFLLLSLLAGFVWSFYLKMGSNREWLLNVSVAFVPLLALIITYPRFRFTTLVYVLCWIYGFVLLYGAHYNYTDPVFNWIKVHSSFKRNNFDRLAHFGQGFVPAIVARELLLRRTPLKPGKALFFLVFAICMAVTALYEIMEMFGAKISHQSFSYFLGTQGDIWDTENDMLSCCIGALVALLVMPRVHDRALVRFQEEEPPKPSRDARAKILSARNS